MPETHIPRLDDHEEAPAALPVLKGAEPKLIEHYDEILAQIDRALGEQTGAQHGSNQ